MAMKGFIVCKYTEVLIFAQTKDPRTGGLVVSSSLLHSGMLPTMGRQQTALLIGVMA
jgi:hypothetical protein